MGDSRFSKDQVLQKLKGSKISDDDRKAAIAILEEIYSWKPSAQKSGQATYTERELIDEVITFQPTISTATIQALDELDPKIDNRVDFRKIKAINHDVGLQTEQMDGTQATHGEVALHIIQTNNPWLSGKQMMQVSSKSSQAGSILASLERLTHLSKAIQKAGGTAPLINFSHGWGNRDEQTFDEMPIFLAPLHKPVYEFTMKRLGYPVDTSISKIVAQPELLKTNLQELAKQGDKPAQYTLDIADKMLQLADTGAQLTVAWGNRDMIDAVDILVNGHPNIHLVAANDADGRPSEHLSPATQSLAKAHARGTVYHIPIDCNDQFAKQTVGRALVLHDGEGDPLLGKTPEALIMAEAEFAKLKARIPDAMDGCLLLDIKAQLKDILHGPAEEQNNRLIELNNSPVQLSRLLRLANASSTNTGELVTRDNAESFATLADKKLEELSKKLLKRGQEKSFEEILKSAEDFCRKHLVTNQQYFALCGELPSDCVSGELSNRRSYIQIISFNRTGHGGENKQYVALRTVDGRQFLAKASEGTSWAAPDYGSTLIKP